ncbi:MAG: DUF1800 domain-containing protein, partial [Planctomycetes bacterium]|nr:DUF1800 domain-containing protein [Planctomycetota bacterium]
MRINWVASCGLMAAALAAANPAWAGTDSVARSRSNLLAPAKQWDADRAAHLLRRAGFGGTPEQIEFLTSLGAKEAVDYLVDYEKIPLNDPDFVPITEPDMLQMRAQRREASDEQRKQTRRRLGQLHRRQLGQLQAWWLRRMILTSRPLQEKMTLFWHGHFTSEFRKVKNSTWLWNQNQFLRTNALGTLRELLIGISKDPAMLRYLDNATNRKAEPNENYARELMELFTMGEGNYTEDDVSEAARAFTGWTATNQGSHLVKRQHDDGKKTVLGRRGRFDGEDVIDIILEQPATARHRAGKLLVFFVEPEPPRELINALAAVLRRSGYDFRETMRVLLGSKVFYSPRAMYAKIKSPVELIVGSVRLLEGR